MWACIAGRRHAARLLLQRGSPFRLKDRDCGYTALHWACANTRRGSERIVEMLLDKGAAPHRPDNTGVVAFDVAKEAGNDESCAVFDDSVGLVFGRVGLRAFQGAVESAFNVSNVLDLGRLQSDQLLAFVDGITPDECRRLLAEIELKRWEAEEMTAGRNQSNSGTSDESDDSGSGSGSGSGSESDEDESEEEQGGGSRDGSDASGGTGDSGSEAGGGSSDDDDVADSSGAEDVEVAGDVDAKSAEDDLEGKGDEGSDRSVDAKDDMEGEMNHDNDDDDVGSGADVDGKDDASEESVLSVDLAAEVSDGDDGKVDNENGKESTHNRGDTVDDGKDDGKEGASLAEGKSGVAPDDPCDDEALEGKTNDDPNSDSNLDPAAGMMAKAGMIVDDAAINDDGFEDDDFEESDTDNIDAYLVRPNTSELADEVMMEFAGFRPSTSELQREAMDELRGIRASTAEIRREVEVEAILGGARMPTSEIEQEIMMELAGIRPTTSALEDEAVAELSGVRATTAELVSELEHELAGAVVDATARPSTAQLEQEVIMEMAGLRPVTSNLRQEVTNELCGTRATTAEIKCEVKAEINAEASSKKLRMERPTTGDLEREVIMEMAGVRPATSNLHNQVTREIVGARATTAEIQSELEVEAVFGEAKGERVSNRRSLEEGEAMALKVLFDTLDTNKNGVVDKREILSGLRNPDAATVELIRSFSILADLLKPQHYAATLNAMDTNKDGSMQFVELLSFCEKGHHRRREEIKSEHAPLTICGLPPRPASSPIKKRKARSPRIRAVSFVDLKVARSAAEVEQLFAAGQIQRIFRQFVLRRVANKERVRRMFAHLQSKPPGRVGGKGGKGRGLGGGRGLGRGLGGRRK